jgi:phosphatidylglycerol---prolipoprotein diacylglyceryl transferase
MNKTGKKLSALLLILLFGFGLLGCQPVEVTNGDGTFTVTFVDYDGTVLKTTECIVGEVCNLVPPAAPDNKPNCYFTRWNVWEADYATLDANTEIKAIYTLSNQLVTIGNRTIVFYSVFIMIGIMLAFVFGIKEGKRTGITQDQLIDGFLWIVPVAILGARLWYVAFEWENFIYGGFFESVLRVIGFYNGVLDFRYFGLSGLAIHGAFFTALVCVLFFAKKRKFNFFKIIDLVAVGFLFAQTFGRWGNFLNQEAHGGLVGGITGGLANWTLEQQYDFLRYSLHLPEFIVNNMYILRGLHGLSVEPLTGFYHPTFLYELTLNWLGFFIMLVLRRVKKVRIGELMAFYLVWYGAVRIFIESMRTDPLMYEIFGLSIKAATTTSVLMIIGGIALSLCIRFWWKGETYASIPGAFGSKQTPVVTPDEKA